MPKLYPIDSHELRKAAFALRDQANGMLQLAAMLDSEEARQRAHCRARRRWQPYEDENLRAHAREFMSDGLQGDDLAEAIAARLARSPVAIAARLVKLGVWE